MIIRTLIEVIVRTLIITHTHTHSSHRTLHLGRTPHTIHALHQALIVRFDDDDEVAP